ncbi:quinone oxidoreductase 1-like isoform X2 [Pocillopora verrucosa]|uniref:quinone oxidoreductase 1-like isoform X2 n=1 Tax=Pocillopora verrucosa TaxID=203993 RepID=UPI00333EA897
MKAIKINETGGLSQLKYEDVPIPEPQHSEVLIKNHTSGVNYLDVYLREGIFTLPTIPAILGVEGAGVVEKLGPGTVGVTVDDRVAYFHLGSGSFAEYSTVPVDKLVKVPSNISFEQAATTMIQGITAHYLVHTVYPVEPGTKVLVHAAAGGTGSLLCQVAKNAGGYVIGTTSTKEKATKAKACGADEVILYSNQDFVQEVNRITEGFKCLATRGTMVLFGGASGYPESLELNLVSSGSHSLILPKLFDYIATPEELSWRANDVFDCITQGKIKMDNFTVFTLSEAKKAFEMLEGKKTIGKLLLKP